MADETIRIGFVGAGANTTFRHIPGFRAIDGVELVSVANRSRESGQRISNEYDIPQIYDSWVDLIAAPDTNAICIGTWPYMHRAMVLAALDSDKHVITEARMAMDAAQAHDMLDASRLKPGLVAQIVPSPMSLKVDQTIQELIADGYMGDIMSVDVAGAPGRVHRPRRATPLAQQPRPERLQHNEHGHMVRGDDALDRTCRERYRRYQGQRQGSQGRHRAPAASSPFPTI